MDPIGNGKRTIQKLREYIRPQAQEAGDFDPDSPDFEITLDDTDTHSNEIAEMYSYTEQSEFQDNLKAFNVQMQQWNLPTVWSQLDTATKKSTIMKLLNQLEVSNKELRMQSAKCILYLVQGCWAEMQLEEDQQCCATRNSVLLYQLGAFNAFTDLLNIEMECDRETVFNEDPAVLSESQDLRIILSVLYTITEVLRTENGSELQTLRAEITGEDLIITKLLEMVTMFCSGNAPHFPMKKILLLLWKLLLVSLGGMAILKQLKAEKRAKYNLPKEDEMKMHNIPITVRRNVNLMKQRGVELEDDELAPEDCETKPTSTSACETPESDAERPRREFPWKPKVRQKDIDAFLDEVRIKFVGYTLQGDQSTLFGLPEPIHEGVQILRNHVYTSLAELQIKKEEEIARSPLTVSEGEIDQTPTEILYQALLPNLPQYLIGLLKILLAAAPTSKGKTDSINILSDVLPEPQEMTQLQSRILELDVYRHKEIIVKAVSAVLLILLKHLKLNHIYQFEFMSQHLVYANCIPLILKFFNQNITGYVGAKNAIPIFDFPACVLNQQTELSAESLEEAIENSSPFSWRNLFSSINLLRILNKLTKWKHSRIMMLVVFKSAPILQRTLKLRNSMIQLYVLKLLKMQTKYLGRQWRKSNMKKISAIYQRVRHRLNDDWAYGNELDARPWDFQEEEYALRIAVNRFNNRRYMEICDSDYEPVDNCFSSVLATDPDLSDTFKRHYDLWLEREVFGVPIEWNTLINA